MIHYLYTNDMRVSSLEEKAESFAKMFLTDTVPQLVTINLSIIMQIQLDFI